MRATYHEMTLWAEAVRQHYMSLAGAWSIMGQAATEEAEFFLNWHYDCCDGLRKMGKKAVLA